MEKVNPILVLASGDDLQFSMLNKLPHTICVDVATCSEAAKNATVILHWSAERELLRESFAMCHNLRWIHSRAAGLDNFLFPELVESEILLTNGRGVFSASLGEFVLAAILYFAKWPAPDGPQPDCRGVEAVRCGRDCRTDSRDRRLWRHWPSRRQPRSCHGHACARHQASSSCIRRPAG